MLNLETGKNNKILRKKSEEIVNFNDQNLKKFITEMKEILSKTSNGIGLAAPQVGKNLRIFIISPELKAPLVFINPEITKKSSKEIELEEGCLSLPGIFGIIKRSKWVKISAYDESGKKFKMKAENLLAQLFQHEVDHLNGRLYADKAVKLFKIEGDTAKEI